MAWNRLSLRTIIRVANLILVVTPYEEEAKAKMGAPKERLFLFPGGIDDVSFSQYSSADPSEFLRHLGIPSDSKIVAFLGTVEKRKNPSAVLAVAEKLTDRADIHFLIAGRGDSEYADTVMKNASNLSNVKYLGEVSERDKVQLMQNSSLNIILSRMEALGLTQLEFMYEGVPVVTSGVGGQSWIVKDGEEGIHVKGADDVDGAFNAILSLVDEKSKWQKLSSNAKEKASRYTLTRLMRSLDDALTIEIQKESGLSTLPSEVRSSMSRPELVVRTWSHGTLKIAATEHRVFIQHGRLSRNTFEIPYSNINSIEHVRQHHWKTLLTGAILSGLLFIQHYISPIISRTLTSNVIALTSVVLPSARVSIEAIFPVLCLFPISAAVIIFLIGIRKGYALNGATIEPIFLPPSFSQAVQYIREMQDRRTPYGPANIPSSSESLDE
jgi:Glycosyl transferases group 1